jgi:L-asparaginase/Glu-tRNA(Gln) amidotransferase subunit D
MAKVNPAELVFNRDDVREANSHLLVRLIRVMFYKLRITNEDHARRYLRTMKAMSRKSEKEINQDSTIARRFVREPGKVTYRLFSLEVLAMGYQLEEMSMRVRDRNTGQVYTFSTDMTADSIDKQQEEDEPTGLDSL